MIEGMAVKKQEQKLSYKELSNCLRILSIDAVERAQSGHPGAPMGMADIATVLWKDFFKVNPKNPSWINRDRFILSNGHASALLYSLLHLTGYDLSLDEIKNFRQLGSKTPGHPETHITPGIEVTTGPLGQGFANSIGIALAQNNLKAKYNKDNFTLFDYSTYVFLGDGCLMEGISHEAASLAGNLNLNNLIAFWDNNKISIDGETQSWFSEDVAKRFLSYGWHVIENIDGHNHDAIYDAISKAKKVLNKPCLIICNTQIGYGSLTKANTSAVHGAPLGEGEIKEVRKNLNWNYEPFDIPNEYYLEFDKTISGDILEKDWNALFAKYESMYPDLAKEILRRSHHILPEKFEDLFKEKIKENYEQVKSIATRKASKSFLDNFMPYFPEIIGGSADLSESNGSLFKNAEIINSNNELAGNYIHYGVREFAMAAIANGLAATDLFIPYVATFLTFIDYARNAIRMSALMQKNVIYILTHDSIGLGEDGPTHQPIEHLTMLRATPNLNTWRPADVVETYVAWYEAISEKNTPSALILTRQNLDTIDIKNIDFNNHIENVKKGAYIVNEFNVKDNKIDLLFIATGSEVKLAIDAASMILNDKKEKKYSIRIVSMPCVEKFEMQKIQYQNTIIPNDVKNTITIEAGAGLGWYKYIKNKGKVISIDTYGESGKANDLFKHFGFTKENVYNEAIKLLEV
tara:strand:- start:18935 stop:21007 length:2073 start_codon:yes stop_codon:yes gene_type:complete